MIGPLKLLKRSDPCRYNAKGLKLSPEDSKSLTTRQEAVAGFDQEVMGKLSVLLIGAGGLGSEISQGIVRKGVRQLKIFDGDIVEPSNLTRQRFYQEDLYKNKALCLAKNLVNEATRKTEIIAYPFMFQRAVEEDINTDCHIAICAPDNNDTRLFTARYSFRPPSGLDQRKVVV